MNAIEKFKKYQKDKTSKKSKLSIPHSKMPIPVKQEEKPKCSQNNVPHEFAPLPPEKLSSEKRGNLNIMATDDLNKVYVYMKKQNRPYSAADVLQNTKRDYNFGKTHLIRLLDELVNQNKLHFKMPSKTKIYLINQSEYEVTSAEEMKTLSNSVLTKTEQAKCLKVQLKELKSKTAEISAMAELIRQKTTLESQLSKFSNAIMMIKQQTSIDPTEIQKEKDSVQKLAKEWRIRKRKGTEILEAILEAYPKPPKIFIEENDIQYDTEPIPLI